MKQPREEKATACTPTVIHRLRQLYMAKVARAVVHIGSISCADATKLVHSAHARVAEATSLRFAFLEKLRRLDMAHRVLFLHTDQVAAARHATAYDCTAVRLALELHAAP